MGLRISELHQAWWERREERGEEGTRTCERTSSGECRQSLNVGKKRKSREESHKARMRKEVIFPALISLPPPVSSLSFPHSGLISPPSWSPTPSLRVVWNAQWRHITGRNQQVTITKILNQTFTWLCPWAVRWQPGRKMEVTGQMQRLRGNPYQTEYYKTILKVNYGDQIEISTYVKHIIS